jgi:Flp pilus assembly protein CpaB
LILIGAVVIGGLAAFLTLSYVRGVETRSEEAGQLVEVVVAAAPVPEGTAADEAISAGAVAVDRRPRSDLPANAVRRLADIGGYVATLDLAGGEVVTTAMFANAKEASGSNVANLEEGNVAVTIQVDQASGVAGLVQPGDRVNVLSRACVAGAGDGAAQDCPISRGGPGGSGDVTISKPYSYLLQNVRVYAVGSSLGEPVAAAEGADAEAAKAAAAEQQQAAAQSGLVTLELPPDQAALLASFRDAELYLTLNSEGYEPVPVPFLSSLPGLPGESAQPVYPSDRG